MLHSFQVSIWSLSLGLLGFCCDCVLNFPEFDLPRLNERLGASDTGQTPPDLDRTVRVMMRHFEYLKLGRAELPVDFPSQRSQLHSVLESSPLKNQTTGGHLEPKCTVKNQIQRTYTVVFPGSS